MLRDNQRLTTVGFISWTKKFAWSFIKLFFQLIEMIVSKITFEPQTLSSRIVKFNFNLCQLLSLVFSKTMGVQTPNVPVLETKISVFKSFGHHFNF